MLPQPLRPLNLHLHRNVTGIHLTPEYPRQESHREPRAAHPPHVLRREVTLRHYPQRLAQEAHVPPLPLRNAHKIHRRLHPLDNREGRGARLVRPVEVTAHGVPRSAGDMRDGQLPQRPPRVWPLRQPIEDFVREPVARARDYRIKGVNVDSLRNVHPLALVSRADHRDGHARRLEDGRRLRRPDAVRAAGAGVRVDEDLCAPAGLGGAVGKAEEGVGEGAGGGGVVGG